MRSVLRVFAAAAAIAATAAPAASSQVPPGFDLFETDPEATVFHFREDFTIPPGFFGPGSDPFTGGVRFGGEPIDRFNNTRVGDADTVVRRPERADPGGRPVPIELVQLNLVSVEPLTIMVGGRPLELWDAKVTLSRTRPSQGAIAVQPQTFGSQFEVVPLFDFRRICRLNRNRCVPEENGPTRRLDVGQLPLSNDARQQLVLQANNVPWRPECKLPALATPLNRGFCPSLDQRDRKALTVEGSRLAKHGIRPAQPRLEHFQCYQSRPLAVPPFRPRVVTLTDQFGAERARVVTPQSLCPPARKNSEEPVENPQAHLQCYAIRVNQRRARPPARVWIRNQFGPQRLRVGAPRRLCVPSRKSRTRQPPAAANPPVEQTLDHFKCYGVRLELVALRARRVRLRDQFGDSVATVRAPTELCAPTRKNRTPSNHPVRHLVCYPIRHPFSPRPVRVDNQFGTLLLRVVRPLRLCVPSLKVWQPVPPAQPPPPGGPPTQTPPTTGPPQTTPPPQQPPPFNGTGRWEPFAPGEVTFIIRFNAQTNSFRLVLPGNRTITNDLPPPGFNCQPQDLDGSPGTMEAYTCTGNLPADTDATGRLQTNPPPQPGMGGQLFGRRNGAFEGPFPITGP